jgi:AcrR family transcriptional regulator
MTRWKPNAKERLVRAALSLFRSQGFAQTTVAEIAERAGLTERTFFRYFADKREVLFAGAEEFEQHFITALDAVPRQSSAIDAAAASVEGVAIFLEERRDFARKRSAVIAENAELRERERDKMASLASALAAALERRGTDRAAAVLAAEMGVTVFRLAFERWIDDKSGHNLAQFVKESFAELKSVTAGGC